MKVGDSFQETTNSGFKLDIEVTERRFNQIGGTKFPVLYVWPEDESVLENFINRRNRPITLYRKEVLPVIKKLFDMSDDVKFSWSNKAGCSCPCSPGFVIKDSSMYNKNIHVTIKSADTSDVETVRVAND